MGHVEPDRPACTTLVAVAGVSVEALVMLSLVAFANRTQDRVPAPASPAPS